MRSPFTPAVLALAAALMTSGAYAGPFGTTPDVNLTCQREPAQVVVILTPGPEVQINAEYGVTVTPTKSDTSAWGISLPMVSKGDSDYFPGSVRLVLPLDGAVSPPSLHVEYAYCSKAGVCMPEDADIVCAAAPNATAS
ncbi:hypothetical protein [Azospirillum sp.]|uniref:hypothetical protein n=1 Tax=Azospirillum sp. TaxID=34012 RepID=UPI003D71943A